MKLAGFELPLPLLISAIRDVPRTVPSVLHNSVPAGEYVHPDDKEDGDKQKLNKKIKTEN